MTRDGATPTPTAHGAPHGFLPHVDGLRALSVVLVVAYHAWGTAVPGGYVGVDSFFVISGFVITRQLYAEMSLGRYSFAVFLARRARRLAPAALACFAAVTIVAMALYYPRMLQDYGKSLAAALGMVANVFFWRTSGYFDSEALEKPLLHIWSLAVEDQFYLVWPPVLVVLMRFTRSLERLVGAVLVLAALSLAHASFATANSPEYAFYMFPTRAWELLLGCVLALGERRLAALSYAAASVLAYAGLAAILASALLLDDKTPFPGLAALPVCLGAAASIIAGLHHAAGPTRLLSLRPALVVGAASYSIYLWHWPFLVFARHVLERAPSPAEALVLVAVSLVVAFASWRFIERPFRGKKPVLGLASPARTFTALIAGSGSLAAVSVLIHLTRGLPERYEPSVRDLFYQLQSESPWREPCNNVENVLVNDETCNFGRPKEPGQSFDIAILGDSNADHFVPMLAKLAAARGLSGRQVTHDACGAVLGAARLNFPARREAECLDFHAKILTFLDRNPKLRLAVLSGVWSSYERGLKPNGLAGHRSFAADATLDDYLAATVAELRRRGIRVLVLDTIPIFPRDRFRLSCFIGEVRTGNSAEGCGFPVERAKALGAASARTFRKLAADDPFVGFETLAGLICGEARCTGFKDGTFLYRDDKHLNAIGAGLLARYVDLPPLD